MTRQSAVIGIGLLLVLAATVGPPPPPGSEPGGSLSVRLPDTVRILTIGLLALAAIILLALQRRPRPGEQALARSGTPRRRSAVVPFLVLVTLALIAYLFWNRWSGGEGHPIETAFTAIAEFLDLLALSRKPATSVPFYDTTVGILVLLLAFAAFALMVVVALADRLEAWWTGRAVPVTAPPRSPSVAEPPADPRAEPDPRLAIICAWRRLEQALAVVRAPRAPWQTPTEFMRATLARLPVPRPPVERLTALFELARFSDRPLSGQARDTACDCLDAITASLETTPPPPPGPGHPRLTPGTRSDETPPPPPGPGHPPLSPGTRSDE
ncbi:MAG TPA: DUF4129 domain-containing protein [Methylomirabilota bacterium]